MAQGGSDARVVATAPEDGMIMNFDDGETDAERPVYNAEVVRVMEVSQGNFHHDHGPPAVVMTISRGDEIEPLAFPVQDARSIVTRLLVALATYDDAFALRLLDDHFSYDKDGEFMWPNDTDR